MANQANLYALRNNNGLEMTVTEFGGRVITLKVPDKNGKLGDIVLGHETPQDYIGGHPYFGALIGRYGNRIGKGIFSIDGKQYHLPINNGQNHLHGGNGFQHRYWKVTPTQIEQESALVLEYLSKDGEEGYPGNLSVKVTFVLTNNNEWILEYSATTDRHTIINLTHHNFYNLAGEGNGDILNHELFINADHITPVDKGIIPTGEFLNVENTPFDFRRFHQIGERINESHEQLLFGKGYDHNWVLNKKKDELSHAATVVDPVSKRKMEVWTTEPGMQLYTGNFLNATDKGKGGKTYPSRSGLCLETQHFPDSPNKPQFPSTLLAPGTTYYQKTVYKFLTE